MNQYTFQIQWEITRAAVSIAAWWVLFYQLHRPQARWRRITLLAAMPAAYAIWRILFFTLPPNSVSIYSILWASITVIFALICGNLRRTLFTAFFYIGMEHAIDVTRSSLIALLFDKFFIKFSLEYYIQHHLQYLLVFGACYYFYTIMKHYRDKPKLAAWILCILPPVILWAILTYFTDIADPLLLEQGINIYGPGFCIGLFCILFNMGILYLYIHRSIIIDGHNLMMEVSGATPLWSADNGLSPKFCERYSLTDRERDIVEIMMKGKSNKEIAEALLLSLRTVESYMQNTYKKTGVSNRFALYSMIKGE
jgi:DNA-binding CsgD family transcriptional regulator